MTNHHNDELNVGENREVLEIEGNDKNEGFNVTNQGQNLGGGKNGDDRLKVGKFADDAFETQTDLSIAQAQPGQTSNNTTQGSGSV